MARYAGVPWGAEETAAFGSDAGFVMFTGHLVAVATLASVDMEERTGWDVPGMFHWRLTDVVALRAPTPCKGAQGFWHTFTLPEYEADVVPARVPTRASA
jgi:hypothetical protein